MVAAAAVSFAQSAHCWHRDWPAGTSGGCADGSWPPLGWYAVVLSSNTSGFSLGVSLRGRPRKAIMATTEPVKASAAPTTNARRNLAGRRSLAAPSRSASANAAALLAVRGCQPSPSLLFLVPSAVSLMPRTTTAR